MLHNWELHKDYQNNLKLKLLFYMQTQRSRQVEFHRIISKLYLLNLDSLLPIIKPLYPNLCSKEGPGEKSIAVRHRVFKPMPIAISIFFVLFNQRHG